MYHHHDLHFSFLRMSNQLHHKACFPFIYFVVPADPAHCQYLGARRSAVAQSSAAQ